MFKDAPNRKKLILVLSAVFVSLTLLTGVLASLSGPLTEFAQGPAQSGSSEHPADQPGGGAQGTDGEIFEQSGPPADSSQADEPPDISAEDPDPALDASSAPQDMAGETEADSPDDGQADEPVYFNVPAEMRGVMISAGTDYLTNGTDVSAQELAAQLDEALAAAQQLTMNTVIIDTQYGGSVLFESSALESAPLGLDVTEYLCAKARDMGFYVYATYDVSNRSGGEGLTANGAALDDLAENIGAFAEAYKPDGILLDGYECADSAAAYAGYLQSGGGMGYEAYQRQVPRALLETAAAAVRKRAPGVQVGLYAQAVWQNSNADPDGSDTKSETTALGTGNADTRAFVKDGLFDFVMVKNYGSTNEETAQFGVVAAWWAGVVDGMDTKLYMMHAADRVGTQSVGWTVYEQLTAQIIRLEEAGGSSGSAFNSLSALRSDPGGSTTTLIQYLNDEINEQWVLTQLAVTKPAELTFTTQEQTVTFQGASDPQADVTINGEKIPTNESGYFTIREDLKAGLNTFTIEHKGKSLTYNITRIVQVIKEVSPTGKISVDGGMQVSVTALAYEGAQVTASVGGQTIQLSETKDDTDGAERDSGYRLYVGVFTAPSASATATSMGNITFTATVQGETQTMQGASVTVNKLAVMGDGAVVYVTADQAETFPTDTLNDNSNPNYFPLPQGTVDKTYGDEIVYKNGSVTKTYWKLESGVRVYSSDIKASGGSMPDQNVISDIRIRTSGSYTTVTLDMTQKVPYKVEYDGGRLVFRFQYTSETPGSADGKGIFESASWDGSNLVLKLKKAGGFIGYRAYYEGDSLNLRFHNSPGGLSGARVVVDPGHGGNDPGAEGFYPGKDEADINYAISEKLVANLKSQGASVLMTQPGSTMATRLAAARSFNAQVLVSVHSNTAQNSSAKGTEVYYFYPFAKQLAANISANVASALGTDNRGAKAGLYYMTRESQFACVLAEIGFLSNDDEYTKMINSKYQNRIAEAIANGVSAYLGGTSSGYYGSDDEEDEDAGGGDEGGDAVESVSLDREKLSMRVGETYQLEAVVRPRTAENKDVTWESDDEDVVEVSSSGELTAVGEGEAQVTVTTDDGGKTATCTVKVRGDSSDDEQDGEQAEPEEGVLVESISISGPDELEAGGSRGEYTGEVSPANAEDPGIKWSVSDPDILEISKISDDEHTVYVEGLREGTAYLIAEGYNGSEAVERFKIRVVS
ncbi:hypothetical protein D3Z39_11990 [Anaerotruncus colihominis]|uniref:N-acetylmuramoyl-L-alanine amidase n=1 Tax=Anaerotruncus colihominis TaxID=169435 RepID=A0A845RL71_9FIRM|nr:hypothetical protein [Anaerotruncus colihominis]